MRGARIPSYYFLHNFPFPRPNTEIESFRFLLLRLKMFHNSKPANFSKSDIQQSPVVPDLESVLPTSPISSGPRRPEHSLQRKDHSELLSVLSPPAIFAVSQKAMLGTQIMPGSPSALSSVHLGVTRPSRFQPTSPLFSAKVNPCLLWKRKLLDQGVSTGRIRKIAKQYSFLRDSVFPCNEMISISS